jgi:gas vesicle protein
VKWGRANHRPDIELDVKEMKIMTQEEQMQHIDEKQRANGNAGAFILGTLIGGLTAALAMLLYAPQSGAETQDQIRSKANEFRMDAEKSLKERRHSAEESIYTGLNNVAGKLEQVASGLNQQVEEMKESS